MYQSSSDSRPTFGTKLGRWLNAIISLLSIDILSAIGLAFVHSRAYRLGDFGRQSEYCTFTVFFETGK